MSNSMTSLLGDKPVHRIGFGAMQLAGPGVFGPPADPENARAVLRRAVELGVNHIDTSQYYGPDVVNALIREALHPYPADLNLVTKVGAERGSKGEWIPKAAPAQLTEQVEDNLRALGTDHIHAVNLRRYDLDEPDSEQPAIEGQLAALAELRDAGKIGHIGVSNVGVAQVRTAVESVGIAEIQNPYSILDRRDQAVLDLAREHGVAYVPYFPLGSAFTGGPQAISDDPRISAVASKHGVEASQIALAWLLAQYEHLLLIPGTKSVAHLESNMAVGDIVLDEDDLAQLQQVEPVKMGL